MKTTTTIVDRIYADLLKNGPSRRSDIADRLGVHQSVIYHPMRRHPDKFRQISKHDRRWRAVRPDESAIGSGSGKPSELKPTTTNLSLVCLGSEYTEAESLFLREVLKWRQANGMRFVGPIESLRLLAAMGWVTLPDIQTGRSNDMK